jgi:hypothetical protein
MIMMIRAAAAPSKKRWKAVRGFIMVPWSEISAGILNYTIFRILCRAEWSADPIGYPSGDQNVLFYCGLIINIGKFIWSQRSCNIFSAQSFTLINNTKQHGEFDGCT